MMRTPRPWANLAIAAWLAATAIPNVAADEIAATDASIADVHIGLANTYKVGHWTLVRVALEGILGLAEPRVAITVNDSDSIATTSFADLHRDSVGRSMAIGYTKVGRVGSTVRITLLNGEMPIDERIVRPAYGTGGEQIMDLPATGQLLVTIGEVSPGLAETFGERSTGRARVTRRIARLEQLADLPPNWFGYDAADVVIIDGREQTLLREWAADAARFAALEQWVELGGRLVIFCGDDPASTMLASDGPLAPFTPGKFSEVVRLPEMSPVEHFAKTDVPIATGGVPANIFVPQLLDVSGSIEVYVGRRATDLPIVVRTVRGFGEITFVGLDVSRPPIAEWPGRNALLQAVLRPFLTKRDAGESAQSLVARGYDDMSGALRVSLGRSFVGVKPVAFSAVVMLAAAYLMALGPIDYLLIHRWLHRPWLAWMTFPVLVLSFGFAAFAFGNWRQAGSGPRVNQLELIDIDATTGHARGTFWAALYSPRAAQFDLGLGIELLGERNTFPTETLLSWWGLPGIGVGGMQSSGAEIGIVRGSYYYGAGLDSLSGVPILTSATKSLMARWTAFAEHPLDSHLADEDGLVAGILENRTELAFRNVRLLYQNWAYRLGTIDPGKRVLVSDEISPRRVKTIVTQDALGPSVPGQAEGTVFTPQRASADQILSLMMFYNAAGGYGFAQLGNEYQADCDLSRLLELGRAILVADITTPGSQLIDPASGKSVAETEDSQTVIYRFVLPVHRTAN